MLLQSSPASADQQIFSMPQHDAAISYVPSSGMVLPQLHNMILVCEIFICCLWAVARFAEDKRLMMHYGSGLPNAVFHNVSLGRQKRTKKSVQLPLGRGT